MLGGMRSGRVPKVDAWSAYGADQDYRLDFLALGDIESHERDWERSIAHFLPPIRKSSIDQATGSWSVTGISLKFDV